MTEEFAALWPGASRAVPTITPAVRPGGLDGKTIALLWDNLFRGEEVFPEIQRALAAAWPGVRFVGYETFGSTFGGGEHEVLERLPRLLREHQVDAVISGIGC